METKFKILRHPGLLTITAGLALFCCRASTSGADLSGSDPDADIPFEVVPAIEPSTDAEITPSTLFDAAPLAVGSITGDPTTLQPLPENPSAPDSAESSDSVTADCTTGIVKGPNWQDVIRSFQPRVQEQLEDGSWAVLQPQPFLFTEQGTKVRLRWFVNDQGIPVKPNTAHGTITLPSGSSHSVDTAAEFIVEEVGTTRILISSPYCNGESDITASARKPKTCPDGDHSKCGTKNGVPRFCLNGICADPLCDKKTYNSLNTSLQAWCIQNPPAPVTNSDSCPEILEKLDHMSACLNANNRMNEVCYGYQHPEFLQREQNEKQKKAQADSLYEQCSVHAIGWTAAAECLDHSGPDNPQKEAQFPCTDGRMPRDSYCGVAEWTAREKLYTHNYMTQKGFTQPNPPGIPIPPGQRRADPPESCNTPSKVKTKCLDNSGLRCTFFQIPGSTQGNAADIRITASFNQALWQGGSGWVRSVPMDSAGNVLWAKASGWSKPIAPTGLPGEGAVLTTNLVPLPGGLEAHQFLVRGGQYWWRRIPLPGNGVPDFNKAPAMWSGPVTLSDVLPGSGTIQAYSEALMPDGTIGQVVWRNNEGWARSMAVTAAGPTFNTGTWKGPTALSALPEQTSVQSAVDIVLPNKLLLQEVWQGGRGWQRTVPITGTQPDFSHPGSWQRVTYESALPMSSAAYAPSLALYATRPLPQTWLFKPTFKCANNKTPVIGNVSYQFGTNASTFSPYIALSNGAAKLVQQPLGYTYLAVYSQEISTNGTPYTALTPTSTPNAAIVAGTFFTPPTPMLRWPSMGLLGGTYSPEYWAPSGWCR